MHALPLLLAVILTLAIAYRYYSAFIAANVLALQDTQNTPAHRHQDGHNYVPMGRWVAFGHHFAAITGAGPLVGPVLAAQFGYLPGLLWLVIGVCLAGAVHDFVILTGSIRRDGMSLVEIARKELGPAASVVAAIGVLFILVVAMGAMGAVIVGALSHSPWGIFTIGMSVPIAICMGFAFKTGNLQAVQLASVAGVLALLASVVGGEWIAASSLGPSLVLDKTQVSWALILYGFFASALPVWMLLVPRDYLSSYMKIGTIFALIVGVLVVNPELHMAPVTQYISGGGPIVPGKLYPFVFITIACGAISGFHGLIASGTTPKIVSNEKDCRMIGYGAMLMEGLVGVTALIAACALEPSDYFAINVTPEKYATLGMTPVELQHFSEAVKEELAGRTGGAVSLAVGMAKVFEKLPGMSGLLGYWYHFAIMFEALFILTTIDAGTRVGRFVLQEFVGQLYKPFARPDNLAANLIASFAIAAAWGWMLLTGEIQTIWPMLGIANQLLASIALVIGTVLIVRLGKARYALVTALPGTFVATTTLYAGYLSIKDNFLGAMLKAGKVSQGYINAGLCITMMSCCIIIVVLGCRAIFRSPAPVQT
jgi:carbon starvation protein